MISVQMGKFVWLYLLNPRLSSMDTELAPLETAGIEVYKNMFNHGDIPITFGVVSSWRKPCFMVLDAFVILCDSISWNLQLMDMERVPWETAKIGIYENVLKSIMFRVFQEHYTSLKVYLNILCINCTTMVPTSVMQECGITIKCHIAML